MPTYLDRILEAHRRTVGEDARELDGLVAEASSMAPTRGFAAALRNAPGLGVIAEIKRHSPSRGALAPGLDPAEMAVSYARGGAACLSVLTDVEFFSGSPRDLVAAREAVGIPVLRKDFTVAAADVCDARIMGADAVLLIVAALTPSELAELLGLAGRMGLDALVEVHDETEAEVALAAGATTVGVNQRDLMTFEVDAARAERVGKVLPDHVVRVAESGIRTADDAARLAAAGFDAVLVGESLVTATDPQAAVAGLAAVRTGR